MICITINTINSIKLIKVLYIVVMLNQVNGKLQMNSHLILIVIQLTMFALVQVCIDYSVTVIVN